MSELEELRRWKSEASEVIRGLQNLGKALDIPLGKRITGPLATEAVKQLKAENERLLTEVERLQKDRDTAQEHVAYHLRDYSLNGEATGDLAVDMAAYSSRLRIRAEAAEAEQAELRAKVEQLKAWRERDYIETCDLAVDRNAAEAKVARVEALVDEWERIGGVLPASQMQRLREILGQK